MGYLCYGRSCHDLQVYGERQGPWCFGSTRVISPLSLANRSRHRQSLRIHHQCHQPHQPHLQRWWWWWRGMERRPSTCETFAISRDCVCFMLIEQVSCFVEPGQTQVQAPWAKQDRSGRGHTMQGFVDNSGKWWPYRPQRPGLDVAFLCFLTCTRPGAGRSRARKRGQGGQSEAVDLAQTAVEAV